MAFLNVKNYNAYEAIAGSQWLVLSLTMVMRMVQPLRLTVMFQHAIKYWPRPGAK